MPNQGRRSKAILFGLMVASAGVYMYLLRLDAVNGVRPVVKFLCAMLCLFVLYAAAARVPLTAGTGWWVAAGAVLFRLILLPAGLPANASVGEKLRLLQQDVTGQRVVFERFQLFDDDIWRYLWDSHVSAAGLNPYRMAPHDVALDALTEGPDSPWSDIRDNVSYPAVSTIYPPLAQWVFRFSHWIAPGSLLIMKGLLTLFDLSAAVLLAFTLRVTGRNPAWALLYAWNPLVVKVFAGSGHVDAIAVTFLSAMAYCLARTWLKVAAVCLGLAILAKISPLVLIPMFWRRAGWRRTVLALAVVLLGYVPFVDAGPQVFGGLVTFGRGWQFNSGAYALLRWVAGHFTTQAAAVAKGICGLLFAAILVKLCRRRPSRTLSREAAPALGWLVWLSPAVMPWYATWALPFAILSGQRIWLIWTAVVCLAFFVMIDGKERAATLALEYGVLVCVWLLELNGARRRVNEAHHCADGFDDGSCIDVFSR